MYVRKTVHGFQKVLQIKTIATNVLILLYSETLLFIKYSQFV